MRGLEELDNFLKDTEEVKEEVKESDSLEGIYTKVNETIDKLVEIVANIGDLMAKTNEEKTEEIEEVKEEEIEEKDI